MTIIQLFCDLRQYPRGKYYGEMEWLNMSSSLNTIIDLRDASRLLSEHLRMAKNPLVVLVGPTASGKTALSLDLAERIIALGKPAEIINADSRQLYRFLDIGTAKIRLGEMRGIPHHF